MLSLPRTRGQERYTWNISKILKKKQTVNGNLQDEDYLKPLIAWVQMFYPNLI